MLANADAAPIHHPSVHFLEFNQANNPNNDYDRFHVLWHLKVNKPPQRKASSEKSNDDDDELWDGIFEGDLVVFPSLLSGAGEFESVRFVGPKTTMTTTQQSSSNEEDEEVVVLPLLTADIEYPEFPTLIVSMAEERKGISLRQMYEQPFEAILQSQSLSLMDLFSNDEESYKDFWEEVSRLREEGVRPVVLRGHFLWVIVFGLGHWPLMVIFNKKETRSCDHDHDHAHDIFP